MLTSVSEFFVDADRPPLAGLAAGLSPPMFALSLGFHHVTRDLQRFLHLRAPVGQLLFQDCVLDAGPQGVLVGCRLNIQADRFIQRECEIISKSSSRNQSTEKRRRPREVTRDLPEILQDVIISNLNHETKRNALR